jgi:hypothetical protein
MIRCPNHTRTKRAHPGGGTPGCRQPLHVKLEVTLDVQANRWPRMMDAQGDFDLALKSYMRKRGARISARDLYECFVRRRWDLVCPGCGYSLRKAMTHINNMSHRMRRR